MAMELIKIPMYHLYRYLFELFVYLLHLVLL